jgi:two-component system cell cycle response regulator
MRVLVADDDDLCRQIVQAILENLGHEVLAADNGQSAWELLLADGAEVVISDWQMPALNGLELCERARNHPGLAYPYFILLTSHGEHGDILAAMQAGVDDHLTKPPSVDDLRAKLIAAARITGLHAELADRHQALAAANQELLDSRGALEAANASLEQLAHRDALTGLGNRLAMNEDIPAIQSRLERYRHGFCIAMLDVDHFKAYNDQHGHQAGDRLLADVGTAIIEEIRPGDLAYRYGGEEFLIVYPNQTVATTSVAVNRIRYRVENSASHTDLPSAATLSAGIAEAGPDERFESIVRRADRALYQAKHDGRNQVGLEPGQDLVAATKTRVPADPVSATDISGQGRERPCP